MIHEITNEEDLGALISVYDYLVISFYSPYNQKSNELIQDYMDISMDCEDVDIAFCKILFDGNIDLEAIINRYNVKVLPYFIILNCENNIIESSSDYYSFKELENEINPFINIKK